MRTRKAYLLSAAVIILSVFIRVLLVPLGDLDEIWVYGVSRSISMGYVPYKDILMVFMPLFNMIFALPLFIFRSLIVYRITTAVFLSLVLILAFDTVSRKAGTYYGLCLVLFCCLFIDIATYNMMMMLFALLLYRALIFGKTRRRFFLAGLFAALSAMSRQTSGGFLLVIVTVYITVLLVRRQCEKKDFFLFLSGAALPCTVFLFYLLATSSFSAFWDCCLFSLFGFAGSNGAVDLIGSSPMLLIVVGGIAADIYYFVKRKDKDHLLHFLAGIPVIIIAVPIFNLGHIIMAGIFFTIPAGEALKDLLDGKITYRIGIIAASFMFIAIAALGIYNVSGTKLTDRYEELKLIPQTGLVEGYEGLLQKNREFKAKGKKVTVFSSSCALISILDGTCDPPYDLFLKGNLGTNDPVSFPEELLRDGNGIIVISSAYNEENWENPEGILEYIRMHGKEIDSYGSFVYYEPL